MYKFTGAEGEFLQGVPAHDLSDDDLAAMTPEQRTILGVHLKTDKPLYELVEGDDKAPAKASPPEVPQDVAKKAPGTMDTKPGTR